MDMVNLKINGIPVCVEKGSTILDAARKTGYIEQKHRFKGGAFVLYITSGVFLLSDASHRPKYRWYRRVRDLT